MVPHGTVYGQNLVPNYSFEEIKTCPTQLDQLRLTGNWMAFGTADPSPDLFNRCAQDGQMGMPNNFFGYQRAKTGEGYAGFIAYLTSRSGKSWKLKSNHREFMVTHLMEPLVEGSMYYVEMSVSLAENCEFAIGNIGVLLSKNIPSFDWMPIELGYFKPSIANDPENLLDNTTDWMKISGTYRAKGGERILTIGNFDADKITVKKKQKKGKNVFFDNLPYAKSIRPIFAYYYVDDVIVRPVQMDPVLTAENPNVTVEAPETETISSYFGEINTGDKIVLQNIYFDFNQSVLLPASYSELQELYKLLLENSQWRIKVTGHTDNIGTSKYNLRLSTDRAKAVTEYLIKLGIAEDRMVFEGRGSLEPVATNATEIGRSKNRRVEFELLTDKK